jgi:hypothetical protein
MIIVKTIVGMVLCALGMAWTGALGLYVFSRIFPKKGAKP